MMIPVAVAAAADHYDFCFFRSLGTMRHHYRRHRGYFSFCSSTMAYHCDPFQFPGASKRAERRQTTSVLCMENTLRLPKREILLNSCFDIFIKIGCVGLNDHGSVNRMPPSLVADASPNATIIVAFGEASGATDAGGILL